MTAPAPKKQKQEVFAPRLRSIKTLWGVDGSDDPQQWKGLFARIKARFGLSRPFFSAPCTTSTTPLCAPRRGIPSARPRSRNRLRSGQLWVSLGIVPRARPSIDRSARTAVPARRARLPRLDVDPASTPTPPQPPHLNDLQAEGFDAVECCVIWLMPGFKAALDEAGLELVAQLHTTSTVREGWAGFRYNTSCAVDDHLASLRELGLEVWKAALNPPRLHHFRN